MNFATWMQDDKPRWVIVRADFGEENSAGVPLLSVPVHRSGSNKQHSMEPCVGMYFEIEFEVPVMLPVSASGHFCHFGLGLLVAAMPTANDQCPMAKHQTLARES